MSLFSLYLSLKSYLVGNFWLLFNYALPSLSSLFSSLSEFTAIYFPIWILMNIPYPFLAPTHNLSLSLSFALCLRSVYHHSILIHFVCVCIVKQRLKKAKNPFIVSSLFLEKKRERFLYFHVAYSNGKTMDTFNHTQREVRHSNGPEINTQSRLKREK